MFKLIRLSIKKNVVSHKGITLFILLCISAALFCINAMLGYVESYYRGMRKMNSYSALTIVSSRDEEIPVEEIKAYIRREEGLEIRNILNIRLLPEEICLFGWEGYEQTKWFPHVSGSFFTEEQVAQSENVIYITSDEYATLADAKDNRLEMDGETYKIIGTGWMVEKNFMDAIGEDSQQTIFQEKKGGGIYYGERYKFRIIPYTTFNERYTPEMVLVQMESASYRQIQELTERLTVKYPGLDVALPGSNSDEYRAKRLQYDSKYIFLLAALLWVTTVNMVREWILLNKNGYRVFGICGATKGRVKRLVLMELFLFTLFGELIALVVQKVVLSSVGLPGVEQMPRLWECLSGALIWYSVTVLGVLRMMKQALTMKKGGELG